MYHHVGPEGNSLLPFSELTDRHSDEWGQAVNFDGPCAQGVREFFYSERLLLDRRVPSGRIAPGCRASIYDDSPVHIVVLMRNANRS